MRRLKLWVLETQASCLGRQKALGEQSLGLLSHPRGQGVLELRIPSSSDVFSHPGITDVAILVFATCPLTWSTVSDLLLDRNGVSWVNPS